LRRRDLNEEIGEEDPERKSASSTTNAEAQGGDRTTEPRIGTTFVRRRGTEEREARAALAYAGLKKRLKKRNLGGKKRGERKKKVPQTRPDRILDEDGGEWYEKKRGKGGPRSNHKNQKRAIELNNNNV